MDRFLFDPLRRFYCSLDTGADGAGGGGSAPGGGTTPASSEGTPAPAGGADSSSGSSGTPDGAGAAPDSGSESMSAFDGMDSSDDLDTIDLGPQPPADGAGAPVPPAAPAAQPPAPPAAAPAAPAEPVAAQPPAAPAKDGTSTPRSPLEQAIEGFKTNNAALSDWAAQNLFALSKEDVEALETDAASVIPKLMGRAYTQALTAAANLMQNFVPQMVQTGVQTHQTTTTKAQEALNEFYTAHPALNAKQHGAAVTKWAKAFRAANPGASRKEAIDYVGRAVALEFNLSPTSAPARAMPFAPAHPGARPPAPPTGERNPFDGMEDDLDS